MPKLTSTRGLRKHHVPGCKHVAQPARCSCPWYGRYKDVEVNLSRFKGQPVVTKWQADLALGELRSAVENGTYQRPRKATQTDHGKPQTFGELVERYTAHHDDEGGFSETSGHVRMLNRLRRELGGWKLDTLNEDRITRWLRDQAKAKKWKPRTWNYYHSTFKALSSFAVDRDWLSKNPVTLVAKRPETDGEEPQRLTAEMEGRLLDACALLDEPSRPRKLTPAQANEIRVRLMAREPRRALATEYGVSYDTVRLIEQGKTWAPFTKAKGTHGREMRRRVLMALRTGARASEILNLVPEMIDLSDPACYVVALDATKGGKLRRKVETEYLYIVDPDLQAEIRDRIHTLKGNPEGHRYLFGREDGSRVTEMSWERLFDLAGIPRGRGKGLTWHHTRHEFISRAADHTENPFDLQRLARHRDLKTTNRYIHKDRGRLVALARKAQGG